MSEIRNKYCQIVQRILKKVWCSEEDLCTSVSTPVSKGSIIKVKTQCLYIHFYGHYTFYSQALNTVEQLGNKAVQKTLDNNSLATKQTLVL